MTRLLPVALAVFLPATDDETGFTFVRVTKNNAIVDVVNDPTPAAGLGYQINLWKNGVDTGKRLFSRSMDPASAGRISVGPIGLGPGDYIFQVSQVLGALAAYSFIVKFAGQP